MSALPCWRKPTAERNPIGGALPTNEMVRVRRERRLVHNGCKSHPGTGSFHPVAIGAVVEVTELLKPPIQEGHEVDSASVQALRELLSGPEVDSCSFEA